MSSTNGEAVALVNWSLAWVRGVSWGLLLLLVQALAFSLYEFFGGGGLFASWDLMLGLIYSVLFIHLLNYQREGMRYVQSESDKFLGKTLVHLNSYIFGLAVLALVSAAKWSVGLFVVEPRMEGFWMGGVLALIGVLTLSYRKEKASLYSTGVFSESRLSYGKRVLFRAFIASLASLVTGFGFLFIGATGIGREQLTQSTGLFLIGVALLVNGIAMGLCWRAARDILRNPAPIYFERTLSRFGFYWFITPLALFFLFLGELLSR